MVECPKCGEKVVDGDTFCPNCGYEFPQVKEVPKVEETSSPVKEGKSYNKIIAIVAIVVIIAIVGVLASGMFSSDNSSDDASVSDDAGSVKNVKENSSSSDNKSTTTEYWASIKADKFHLPTCEWAEKISDDNKIIYSSRDDAIADGKEPCGACNP